MNDKAKVENGVLVAERWILARLRNRRLYSLAEANTVIAELVAWINDRPFKKMPGSRAELFSSLERPVMGPLPASRYQFATWRLQLKVNIDYHVEDSAYHHYYSVPHQLVGRRVDLRLSSATVEVFCAGRRVASHLRRYQHGFSTDPAHMPESHRRHAEWTPSRIVAWARKTGPATASLCEAILTSRPHPEQGYRSCLGIIRLSHRYGTERLEAACGRALSARALSYRSVESILRHGLDTQELTKPPLRPHRHHQNLRGPAYYA